MRVTTRLDGSTVEFSLALDPDDHLDGLGQGGMPIRLTAHTARIELPVAVDPHADLVALATLTIVRPWVGRRLQLSQAVSEQFATAVQTQFGFEIGPVDSKLSPRLPGSRIGLLYSGGPDALASEVLLGGSLPSFHHRRVRHPAVPNRAQHLRADVQERIVRQSATRGRELWVSRSDLEFLCLPYPTFPQNLTLGASLILLADHTDLGGCAIGHDFDNAYLYSGRAYVLTRRRTWRDVLGAAGLELIQATAGATAVASMKMARHHPEFEMARSCLLGTDDGPCLSCEKCLRRALVRAYLEIEPIPLLLLERITGDAWMLQRLSTERLYAEAAYAFLLARLPQLAGTAVASALERLQRPASETTWVERWYRRAVDDWIPQRHRHAATELLERHVGFMTPGETATAESWRNRDFHDEVIVTD